MSYLPHVFAGNPLDRGDRERRDEKWLAARAVDPTSRFLVMPDLDVPTTVDGGGALRWLTPRGRAGLRHRRSRSGVPREAGRRRSLRIACSGHRRRGGAAQGATTLSSSSTRGSAAGFLSGHETGIVAQVRALLDWHNRHGFCSVCGHPTEMGPWRTRTQMPGVPGRALPPHRPGGDHARPRRRPMPAGPCPVDGCRACGCTRPSPGFIDQGESIEEAGRARGQGGSGHRRQKHHVPLVAAVAVPILADDRVPRRGRARPTSSSTTTENDRRCAGFDPPGGARRARKGGAQRWAVPQPLAIAHHLIKTWAQGEI